MMMGMLKLLVGVGLLVATGCGAAEVTSPGDADAGLAPECQPTAFAEQCQAFHFGYRHGTAVTCGLDAGPNCNVISQLGVLCCP